MENKGKRKRARETCYFKKKIVKKKEATNMNLLKNDCDWRVRVIEEVQIKGKNDGRRGRRET